MNKSKLTPKIMAVTALLMAMTVVMSSFSIPVPGGHLYLNDTVICMAAILLEPFCAFVVGGIGAFLGDFFFYPTPMFVSLVTHGVQAVLLSQLVHKSKNKKLGAALGLVLAAAVNVIGYSVGRAFLYSTPETALVKLPFQCLQGLSGSILAPILCWKCGIQKAFDRIYT